MLQTLEFLSASLYDVGDLLPRVLARLAMGMHVHVCAAASTYPFRHYLVLVHIPRHGLTCSCPIRLWMLIS